MKNLIMVMKDRNDDKNVDYTCVAIEDDSRSDEVFALFGASIEEEEDNNEEYTNESIYDLFVSKLKGSGIKTIDANTEIEHYSF